jgi:predicted Fe-Mo cluster-binding NifX family protein
MDAYCGRKQQLLYKEVNMKIGVTSQNMRTITAHAGKARRFMIYEVSDDGQVKRDGEYSLPKEMSLHEHPRGAAHLVDDFDVLITGSCGEGFLRKMAARGVKVVVTGETDPLTAITKLLSGAELAPPIAEDEEKESCGCQCSGGGHGHGH